MLCHVACGIVGDGVFDRGVIGVSVLGTFQEGLEMTIEEGDYKEEEQSSPIKMQAMQRDLLNLQPLENPSDDTRASQAFILLGHGEADERMPVGLGWGAARVMRDAGYDVEWKYYEDQGHWYKIPNQIDDIVSFTIHKFWWESALLDLASLILVKVDRL
ncbi:hypothetical protein ACKRZS_006129 [Fusarium odoratissimum]|uniref:Peptidase S9 prolyl oligopeptidase catalytic domain-containing protein n=2 Tax=Fusarium oxysporum f. sp. cubense (strain race 4) TaxID=2502994 RepID=N1RRC2_FUSC4|nr:hypothetical protein FOC4_g10007459 [Fusarium odoratissimum]